MSNSKVRLSLVGLTVFAVLGLGFAGSPAEAGKKKQHKKHAKLIKQNARGGDARGGDGGTGGAAGASGPDIGPVGGITLVDALCVRGVLPINPADFPVTFAGVEAALVAAGCFADAAAVPDALVLCLLANATPAPTIPESAAIQCLGLPPGDGVDGLLPGGFLRRADDFTNRGGDARGGRGGNNAVVITHG